MMTLEHDKESEVGVVAPLTDMAGYGVRMNVAICPQLNKEV